MMGDNEKQDTENNIVFLLVSIPPEHSSEF